MIKPRGYLFAPTLVAPDGGRHLLPNRHDPAYCGQVEGERHAPAWVSPRGLCQSCRQQYVQRLLAGRSGTLN